jgi:hypothetical protein
MNDWSLREAVLDASHRWYWIVFLCLVGAFTGWLFAIARPSPSQATLELYVGLNIYQAADDRNAAEYAGLPFGNINDYKNWQMANLNSLIYMDSIVNETLRRLQAQDPYWLDVSTAELTGALHAYWRNAGKWRLEVELPDPRRASQAVSVWQDVVVERVHQAVIQSRNALSLSSQIRTVADARIQAMARLAQVIDTRDKLAEWQVKLEGDLETHPVEEGDRQLIWLLLVEAGKDPSWQPVLQSFPVPQSVNGAYRSWLVSVMPLVEEQLSGLQEQISFLEKQEQDLSAQYAQASRESLGLSAELEVQQIANTQPEQDILRPIGQLMLIGSFLGFALWVVVWLVKLSLSL